nr:uncharacterized mitochondrial protein AtMg00810-like [Tanacetum cinerariifolium]
MKIKGLEFRHVARECQKPKRAKDAAYHREKMLLYWELEVHYMYMAQIQEVSPDAADSGPIFDAEPLQKVSNDDHYNVFAIESKHPEQSESIHDTYPIKQNEHNIIIDSLDMSYDREQIDQNDNDNDLANEPPEYDEVIRLEKESRSKLNDLIRPFDYEKLNNLYDLFVPQREKSSEERYFSEISRLSHTSVNNGNLKESFNKQTTLLEKRMDESISNNAHRTYYGYLDPFIQNTIEANFSHEIKRINAGLEQFHVCLNEEMVADLRYFNSLELEVESLRSQLESQKKQFLNEIDRLSKEYYYVDHKNAILSVYTKLDKVTNLQCDYLELLENFECLEKELSKSKMMSKSFQALQEQPINLEIDLHQCQEKIKNDKSFKENLLKEFQKECEQYFEIQDLKTQLQDKGIVISELKKLIEKLKGKSVDTKFGKSSVIRQPNAFKSQRPSILGKPTIFSYSLERKDFSKSKSVTQNNVSNDFSKPVTAQTLPPIKKSILKNTNVLAPGMYKLHTEPTQARTSQLPQDSRKTNKRVSFSTGVILTTSVSRPQLKSNPMEDKAMLNNSKGKKQEVEDHHRNVNFSKNKTFVTACNDSLNAKTLNVNFVCATCGKCVLNAKHDMCVLKSCNSVNSRTKMPIAMPVSTREPNRTVIQSVAKPIRKTVASKSNQKPRNSTRKLYERLVDIFLFIVDPGCSKHMMGNLKILINFVEKFLGMMKFGNDQIAPILGYGDLVQGVVTIKRVYYVEGLNHNLFSVDQFCDADLEVAFRKSTCYIRDLKGNYLLTDSRGTDLYSITLHDTNSPNPICLREWYNELSNFLFSKGSIDPTLFITKHRGDILLVQIYVDDIIFGSTNQKLSKQFEKLMHSKFEMSMMGELKFFLGIQIYQSPRGIFINQAKYAQEILIKHGMTSCDSVGTPMATKHLDANLSGTPVDQTKYHSMVGALMYLTASRPDIIHATCYCARYQANPIEKHLIAIKRIFRYLKDTIHMGLWYPKDTGFELTAFLDSDHAGCLDSRKSTSGGIQFLGGDKLVSWSSKKQDCTSMSSAEVEYVFLSACCAQVLWMRTQLTDYGFHFDKIPIEDGNPARANVKQVLGR